MVKKQRIIRLFGIAITAMLLAGCTATEPTKASTPTPTPSKASAPMSESVSETPTPKPTTPTPGPTAEPTLETTVTPTSEPTPAPTLVDKTEALLSTFVDTGDSELNEMCDEILKEIINTDMTEREKAYAIYQWVNQNVKYRGTSDTSDWVAGSKYALAYKKGNCYAFYAASRGLLTRAGFENVEATEYNFTHYWNIVKVDGVWRHFDATTGWGTERFLWTGTQILEYSYYSEGYGRNIIYEWNPEGCPDTD